MSIDTNITQLGFRVETTSHATTGHSLSSCFLLVPPFRASCSAKRRMNGGKKKSNILLPTVQSLVCPYNPGQKSWYTWPFLTISPFLPPSPHTMLGHCAQSVPLEGTLYGGRGEGQVGKKSRFRHRTGGDDENIQIFKVYHRLLIAASISRVE